MTYFNLSLSTLLIRYYLMMTIVIAAGMMGNWWLALLALPVFISNILGVQFSNSFARTEAKSVALDTKVKRSVKAA